MYCRMAKSGLCYKRGKLTIEIRLVVIKASLIVADNFVLVENLSPTVKHVQFISSAAESCKNNELEK